MNINYFYWLYTQRGTQANEVVEFDRECRPCPTANNPSGLTIDLTADQHTSCIFYQQNMSHGSYFPQFQTLSPGNLNCDAAITLSFQELGHDCGIPGWTVVDPPEPPGGEGPPDPPGPPPGSNDPPTNPPDTTATATTNMADSKIKYNGTFIKNESLKYGCDAASLSHLYKRLKVDTREEVVAYNSTIDRWVANTTDAATEAAAETNMNLYRDWIANMDYDCSDSPQVAVSYQSGVTCQSFVDGKTLTLHDQTCCNKAVMEAQEFEDDAASLGACVPESVNSASKATNAENTQRVQNIIESISAVIEDSAYTNLSTGDLIVKTGPQTGWDALFPLASMGGKMIDGIGELTYTYDNFLRAVETFPAFCGKKDGDDEETADLMCRRQLAVAFSHFTQETGANTSLGNYDVTWKQGLWYNAEAYFSDPDDNLFEYTPATYDEYKVDNFIWYRWTPEVPGRVYPGRGVKQLTFSYNYAFASDSLFANRLVLLEEPDLVLTGPVAFMGALWFFLAVQPPKPSMLDVIRGNVPDSMFNFGMTTQIINGGRECNSSTPAPNAVNRLEYFDRYSQLLGIPSNDPFYTNSKAKDACCSGCYTGAQYVDAPFYWDKLEGSPGCKTVNWQTAWQVNDPSGLGLTMCMYEYEHYK